MNGIDRRLIELNLALIKLNSGETVDPKLLEQAIQALAGSPSIDTGSGNDTVIINNDDNEPCQPCPPGPIGYTGSQGEIGYTGSMGYTGSIGYTGSQGEMGPPGICYHICHAKVVSEDYQATADDHYIGVDSEGPVTITLPEDCKPCQDIIIKAEMAAPLGNRKVTITTSDGSTIDGDTEYVLTIPWESVNLFCRGGNWYIV